MSDPTAAELDAHAEAGNQLAGIVWPLLEQQKAGTVMNCVGNLVVLTFASINFDQPQHALEEFDNWTKYTREIIAATIRERLS